MSKFILTALSLFMVSPVTAAEIKKCPFAKSSIAVADDTKEVHISINTDPNSTAAKKEK